MAKAKSKLNSRASRRQQSPGMDIDKSPSTSVPMQSSTNGDAILHDRHDAGISKQKTKQKPMSRHQRLRKEKGLARAESVIDQLQKKVGASKVKGRAIKERAADWEDLNDAIKGKSKKERKKARRLAKKSDEATGVMDAHDDTAQGKTLAIENTVSAQISQDPGMVIEDDGIA